ncbi:DUF4893 domain-containing protein [Sphingomonas bacterium]|uniref:DUF4893 domain-containing protein n=1 Tax=Sphingomonas bacterium TaxID=1895847 RepID=UPI0015774A87|nr:DUF4893 domain-containing protein [Sphingomonas bacterium]
MTVRTAATLALMAVVASQPVGAARDLPRDWRRVATLPDRDRLRRLRMAWTDGVRLAYANGLGGSVRSQGVLLDPDVALADPLPPPGRYRCRVVKLGGPQGFSVRAAVPCEIAATGPVLGFSMLGAAQRTTGTLFADTDVRGVFLGSLAMADEGHVLAYGRDVNRNMAGVVERVGPSRWRIGFPYPRFEATLDVIELVPSS